MFTNSLQKNKVLHILIAFDKILKNKNVVIPLLVIVIKKTINLVSKFSIWDSHHKNYPGYSENKPNSLEFSLTPMFNSFTPISKK